MGNKKYVVDNQMYQTDKRGRPILAKASIKPKFKGTKIYERDKTKENRILTKC